MKEKLFLFLGLVLFVILLLLLLCKTNDKNKKNNNKVTIKNILEKCKKNQNFGVIDSLETVNFINFCTKIIGNENICIKNVDYSSKDIYEMNKQNKNLQYALYKTIMVSLINPEIITTLYLFFLKCKNLNSWYKIYYNSNKDIEYLNIIPRTDDQITFTNKTLVQSVLDIEQKPIDNTLFLFTVPYYNLLKEQYDNGDYDDNTENITINLLINVTMAEISRGGAVLDISSLCDQN